MPIPGPGLVAPAVEVIPTGSPFWICLHGVWLQVEGIAPSVTASTDRPRSTFTSVDGNRYEQRSPRSRRSWSWSLPHSAAAHLAAVRAAVESETDVWLMTDPASLGNMLPARASTGTELPALDCGGVPLPTFAAGSVVTGRVRGGVPTTVSCWTAAAAAMVVLDVTYPGGGTAVASVGVGERALATFTPTADGEVSIEIAAGTTGLMLTEGDPEPTFVHGEGSGMPCRIVVDDPDDTLTMHHSGAWRHDYTVALREVG